MSQSPPPGWYADPQGLPLHRWWDGNAWTGHTAEAHPAAPAASAQQGFYGGTVSGFYGGTATGFNTPAAPTAYRPAIQTSGWSRNQYAFITFGLVALYAFIALKAHVYILGVLPIAMSIRSQNRKEPLGIPAIIAACVAVLIGIIGLTHQ